MPRSPTDRFDLMTRPGFGRWRRVAANVTLREAVALVGDPAHGPKADYWFHELREVTGDDVQDVQRKHLVGDSLDDGEARPD